MITTHIEKPFDHIKFTDFFSDDQLPVVWDELKFFINNKNYIESGPVVKTDALDFITKESVAKRHSFFIDDCLINFREKSNIYKFINTKLYKSNLHINHKNSLPAQYIPITNHDSLLVSLYNSDDYYKQHVDASVLTFICYLYYKKNHEGGELIFEEYNYKYTPTHNSGLLFPSCIKHGVSPIIQFGDVADDFPYQRISLTLFVGLALTSLLKSK
jgi:hypothetical protein